MRNRFFRTVDHSRLEEPTVNLTPLIDVVFVILIIFIVIAPLLELDRVELATNHFSNLDSKTVQETSSIAIHVHSDNTIWLNNHAVANADFLSQLKKVRSEHPHAQPQVFFDRKAHFGTYQLVKNTMEHAGFATMDIVLQPS